MRRGYRRASAFVFAFEAAPLRETFAVPFFDAFAPFVVIAAAARPAFAGLASNALHTVSVIRRVTTYGSILALGRLSSIYPFRSRATCHGIRTDAPRSETP